MTIRALLIVAGLATLAGGCTVVTPGGYDDRVYREDHRVYRDTDAYEGYYYAQIVYINGEPWYVDDYRRARPIPRQLHSHFQYSSWTRSLPPRFSSDREERNGYPLSRIVYINDVPHYVDDDRRGRPVPPQLRSQFSYQAVVPPRDAGRNGGERRQPPQPYYDSERPMPPANARGRERQEPPAYGREREREVPPSGRERERMQPPAYGAESMPKPAMMQERMRDEPQGRQAPPSVRNGGSGPAGQVMEQPSDRGAGRGRPMPQENSRKTNDDPREGGVAEKKNGKATGRGKGVDENGRDEENGKGATKQRGE